MMCECVFRKPTQSSAIVHVDEHTQTHKQSYDASDVIGVWGGGDSGKRTEKKTVIETDRFLLWLLQKISSPTASTVRAAHTYD